MDIISVQHISSTPQTIPYSAYTSHTNARPKGADPHRIPKDIWHQSLSKTMGGKGQPLRFGGRPHPCLRLAAGQDILRGSGFPLFSFSLSVRFAILYWILCLICSVAFCFLLAALLLLRFCFWLVALLCLFLLSPAILLLFFFGFALFALLFLLCSFCFALLGLLFP
jgi:hypothetical protein